jgi:hypothetical protein
MLTSSLTEQDCLFKMLWFHLMGNMLEIIDFIGDFESHGLKSGPSHSTEKCQNRPKFEDSCGIPVEWL